MCGSFEMNKAGSVSCIKETKSANGRLRKDREAVGELASSAVLQEDAVAL